MHLMTFNLFFFEIILPIPLPFKLTPETKKAKSEVVFPVVQYNTKSC